MFHVTSTKSLSGTWVNYGDKEIQKKKYEMKDVPFSLSVESLLDSPHGSRELVQDPAGINLGMASAGESSQVVRPAR